MDAPPVQYVQTEDGVSLAYATWGTGPPLIVLRGPRDSNVQEEWGLPELADWYAALGEAWRVVRFDHRGCGGSDPSPGPGLDDYLRDIQAVQTAADADRAVILSSGRTATVALELAARRSESVLGLVLVQPQINFGSVSDDEPYAHIAALRVSSPSVWHETIALWMGWRERASRDAFVQIGLANEPANVAYSRAIRRYSLEDVLPAISVATVVIRLTPSLFPTSPGRRIAGAVPGAKLVAISSEGHELAFVHRQDLLTVLDQLRPGGGASLGAHGARFRTILFTDVVASTPLLAQLKDERMRAVMRDHDAVLQAAVESHEGRVVKTIGDAFMADFAVPSAAVECAIAMQRGIRDRFADSEVPIRLRIGINAGEPIVEDDDLHGASVVIAKRLESAAPTDGILVSDVVKQAVVGKDFSFADQGEVDLKGFEEPVRAWAVDWES